MKTSTLEKMSEGFTIPFKGVWLILSHRSLWFYFFLTFLVSATFLFIGGAFGVVFLREVIPEVVQQALIWMGVDRDPFWRQVFRVPMSVGVWIVGVIVLLYFLVISARLLASPFYSCLAEKVYQIYFDSKKSPLLRDKFSLWLRTLWILVTRFLIFAVLGAFLFILSLIPIVNIIGVVGLLFLIACDFFDYGNEAAGASFRERVGFFWRERAMLLGFCINLGFVLLIPFANLLFFSAAVVGATQYIAIRNQNLCQEGSI